MDTVPRLDHFTAGIVEYYFENINQLFQMPAFEDGSTNLIVADQAELELAWRLLRKIDSARIEKINAENDKPGAGNGNRN